MVRILVLLGGNSPESEISLRSGSEVARALKAAGYFVTTYNPKDGTDLLVKEAKKADLVIPVLHGLRGEDGFIQRTLETNNIKFLGAESEPSAAAFDKGITHKILGMSSIIMPKFELVDINSFATSELSKKPHVLKNNTGGSSIDIVIARKNIKKYYEESINVLKKYNQMILEELIEGQEVTVSILGDTVLPLIAIQPPRGQEFDLKNKYNGKSKEICPVPEELIPVSIQNKISKIAYNVHKILKIRHLSRTDMIIDKNGKIYVLELNTFPGMTKNSLFPKAAKSAGLSMIALVKRFVELGLDGS